MIGLIALGVILGAATWIAAGQRKAQVPVRVETKDRKNAENR